MDNIFQPCDALKPFIKSIVISRERRASTYRVLPDTSISIGFLCRGKLSLVDNGVEFSLGPA